MNSWIEGVAGPEYAFAIWIISGLVLLLLVLLLVRLLRSFASGTFVAGGRNRRARLAVMDAAPIDTRRRLVLVRRDDVEHLILIGGPTDVVIEQDIRMVSAARRQAPAEPEPAMEPESPPVQQPRQPSTELPRPRLVTPPAPAPVKPAEATQPAAPKRDFGRAATPPTAAPAQNAARPEPVVDIRPAAVSSAPAVEPRVARAEARPDRAPPPVGAVREQRHEPEAPAAQSIPTPAAPPDDKDDEALMRELEVTLDGPSHRQPEPASDEISLEEEMSRLLGDLSSERR